MSLILHKPSLQTELRRQLIHNDTVCAYCGATDALTIDHIIRKTWAKGFNPNGPSNLQVICVVCHRKKYAIEENVQDWVMMGRIGVQEGLEYIRNWSPGKRTKTVRPDPSARPSTYLWQKDRTFTLHLFGSTFGVKVFAKRKKR